MLPLLNYLAGCLSVQYTLFLPLAFPIRVFCDAVFGQIHKEFWQHHSNGIFTVSFAELLVDRDFLILQALVGRASGSVHFPKNEYFHVPSPLYRC